MRVMRIVDAVRVIREQDPGIGYYKLWLMMNRMFLGGWVPGRDSFLRLLRDFRLMQKRPKPRCTTNSNHRYRRYKNLIRGFVPTRPHYSIGMKTPSEVHTQTGPQKVMWKSAGEFSGAVCPLPQGTP